MAQPSMSLQDCRQAYLAMQETTVADKQEEFKGKLYRLFVRVLWHAEEGRFDLTCLTEVEGKEILSLWGEVRQIKGDLEKFVTELRHLGAEPVFPVDYDEGENEMAAAFIRRFVGEEGDSFEDCLDRFEPIGDEDSACEKEAETCEDLAKAPLDLSDAPSPGNVVPHLEEAPQVGQDKGCQTDLPVRGSVRSVSWKDSSLSDARVNDTGARRGVLLPPLPSGPPEAVLKRRYDPCEECGHPEHSKLYCPKVPPREKLKIVLDLSLCLVCFRGDHCTTKCPKEYRCKKCGGRHSVYICLRQGGGSVGPVAGKLNVGASFPQKGEQSTPVPAVKTGRATVRAPPRPREASTASVPEVLPGKRNGGNLPHRSEMVMAKAKPRMVYATEPDLVEFRPPCTQCDGNDHAAMECGLMDPMFKSGLVRRHRICLSCFGSGHFRVDCPTPVQCARCTGQHHPLLDCDAVRDVFSDCLTSEDGNAPGVGDVCGARAPPPQGQVMSVASSDLRGFITLMFDVGEVRLCGILDTGAKVNLLPYETAEALGLRGYRSFSQVSTPGGVLTITEAVDLQVDIGGISGKEKFLLSRGQRLILLGLPVLTKFRLRTGFEYEVYQSVPPCLTEKVEGPLKDEVQSATQVERGCGESASDGASEKSSPSLVCLSDRCLTNKSTVILLSTSLGTDEGMLNVGGLIGQVYFPSGLPIGFDRVGSSFEPGGSFAKFDDSVTLLGVFYSFDGSICGMRLLSIGDGRNLCLAGNAYLAPTKLAAEFGLTDSQGQKQNCSPCILLQN